MKNRIDRVGQLIDPPGGWRFGFPKPYMPRLGENMRDWLVREGYPESEVDFALNYLRVIDTSE